jgi:DNA invertase Pin-like site-specific DNA recombinase
MTKPVAYLRKSHVNPAMSHVSWEMQESEVRALAARRGDAELSVLSDWSKSGREAKTRLRQDYLKLKEMIAAGQVSAVYSYSLSRLARSTRELLTLAELCAAHKVPIRLCKEGDLDFGSSHGKLYLTVLAGVATFEADVSGERMTDAVRARRARGDALGIAPYGWMLVDGKKVPNPSEPIEPLIAAFEKAGSAFAAARMLSASGLRTRRGYLWSAKTVTEILRREGVMVPHFRRQGAKPAADWIMYQLITCHCGATMTPCDTRGPRLTCTRARVSIDHPKPFGIADTKLLPAMKAEAAHLRAPSAVEVATAGNERREALSAKRARIIDTYTDGAISKSDRDARLRDVDQALEKVDAETRIVDLPSVIDWSWPPRQLNAVLRAIWERVELGPDMQPARFVWRVPEWRSVD